MAHRRKSLAPTHHENIINATDRKKVSELVGELENAGPLDSAFMDSLGDGKTRINRRKSLSITPFKAAALFASGHMDVENNHMNLVQSDPVIEKSQPSTPVRSSKSEKHSSMKAHNRDRDGNNKAKEFMKNLLTGFSPKDKVSKKTASGSPKNSPIKKEKRSSPARPAVLGLASANSSPKGKTPPLDLSSLQQAGSANPFAPEQPDSARVKFTMVDAMQLTFSPNATIKSRTEAKREMLRQSRRDKAVLINKTLSSVEANSYAVTSSPGKKRRLDSAPSQKEIPTLPLNRARSGSNSSQGSIQEFSFESARSSLDLSSSAEQTPRENATMKEIFEWVVLNGDAKTTSSFVMAFRSSNLFVTATNPSRLMYWVSKMFEKTNRPEEIRKLFNFMETWLQLCYERDFDTGSPDGIKAYDRLSRFKHKLREEYQTEYYEIERIITTCLSRASPRQSPRTQTIANEESEKILESLAARIQVKKAQEPLFKPTFMNMDAEIFACQLTKIEGDLFRSLTIEELYGGSWNKPDAALRTPNIHRMTLHCNRMSNWVAAELISSQTHKEQLHKFKKLLMLLKSVIDLKNYNAMLEIYLGINLVCERARLANAWKEVPKNFKKVFETVQDMLMSNYSGYRKALRADLANKEPQPVVPILAVCLKDIFNVLEVKSSECEGRVDFDRLKMLGSLVLDIKNVQNGPQRFSKEDGFFQNFWTSAVLGMSISEEQILVKAAEKLAD